MTTAIPILERRDGKSHRPAAHDIFESGGARPVPTDVRAVLDRAVWTGPHTEARITVVCEVNVADVDPAFLLEAVVQLLHLEDDLPETTSVWVTAVAAAGGVVVTVEDDAPAGTAHRLALPVARGARATAALRLARVSQLARRHGGEMWIEDAPGGGLCYAISLPGFSEG